MLPDRFPVAGDVAVAPVIRDPDAAVCGHTLDDRGADRRRQHDRGTVTTLHRRHDLLDGRVDELVEHNPVKLKRGELPKKQDADPEWRSRATYTVREVERLISDARIPPERRVQYALKAIAGLRHGEVAALGWRHIDHTAEPLARINVVRAFCSKTGRLKSTKTGETRAVPLHPVLAKILAAWKLSHWERIYGRPPTDDDLVVPTRNLTSINVADANHAMKEDLAMLGLRVDAGEARDRGGHDLRSWYQTRCIEDGADSLHHPPHDARPAEGCGGGLRAVLVGHDLPGDRQAQGRDPRRRGPAACYRVCYSGAKGWKPLAKSGDPIGT